MKRINGILLMFAGGIHIILGTVSGWQQLKAMVNYGLWNALIQHSQSACIASLPCMQMNTIWWFISFGLLLVLLGLTFYVIESIWQRCVPACVGWLLLIVSLFSAVLVPASGFWFVLLVSINIIICAARFDDAKV